MNKWKNSKKSVAFIALSMWPMGFIIFGSKTPPFETGQDLAIIGSVLSLFLVLAALALALVLRFFVAPKTIKEEEIAKRNLQAWVLSFVVAILIGISSIYTGSWAVGLPICGLIILLGYGVKKKVKGSIFGLVLLSAAGVFVERYFDGSSAFVWTYSVIYWTSMRYGLNTKTMLKNVSQIQN